MKTFKFLLVLSITLATFLGCKKEKISTVNRNFSIEVIRSQGGDGVVVGEKIPFKLTIKDFDLQNNLGQIETFFYVRNKGGESKGKFSTSENKDIPIGENFEYDYRKNKMVLDFFFTPTQDGDQEIVAEIRCQGVIKDFTFPIILKSKGISITSTVGGQITYQDKTDTSFNLYLKYGETIKLRAIAQDRYKFLGWYVGGKVVSTTLDYIHRVENNDKIEARFRPMSYQITPKINIAEAGVVSTASGKNTFEDGDLVSVQVNINEKHKDGYIFKGWYINNTLVSDKTIYTFNAKDDVSPEARFEAKTYSFKYNTIKDSSYIIKLNGVNTTHQNIKYGTKYTLYLEKIGGGYSNIYIFSNAEIEGKVENPSQIILQRKKHDKLINSEEIPFICRGDIHIRVYEYGSVGWEDGHEVYKATKPLDLP